MSKDKPVSPIDVAASRLRDVALTAEEGTLLGSEDALVEMAGVSRVTVRQAARLLEREGLLKVKRGINGGYFASRPDADLVVATVCNYLDSLGFQANRTGNVSTALWVETLRQAACADRDRVRKVARELVAMYEAVPDEAPAIVISQAERDGRKRIFELIDGAYIDLIFQINVTFARSKYATLVSGSPGVVNSRFARRWRQAKLAELDAIVQGDELLAMMAALHTRRLWEGRAVDWSQDDDSGQ
ncbi:GntR family transcriptional regulator [Novosphingobium sp.]|uniref:GntR family transcriptional regulator n=1 Tax=Novosphingobium sp. TaxID=1874826 RepID=UPI00286DADFD|nr:GntR family transcriptional regulator [Novosphingobium sp.]